MGKELYLVYAKAYNDILGEGGFATELQSP